MKTYGLQVITAPTSDPIAVEELANYLRADPVEEATALQQLISLAVEEVERYTGRAVLSTQYRYTLADWPRRLPEFATYPRNVKGDYLRTIELPRSPVTAVASVSYYPANSETLTTLPAGQYLSVTSYEPGMVYLKDGYDWPEPEVRPDAVQIVFTAGYTEIPKIMKQALLLLGRFYYAGGNPNDVDQGGNDLEKAHHLLNNLRVSGWSA